MRPTAASRRIRRSIQIGSGQSRASIAGILDSDAVDPDFPVFINPSGQLFASSFGAKSPGPLKADSQPRGDLSVEVRKLNQTVAEQSRQIADLEARLSALEDALRATPPPNP